MSQIEIDRNTKGQKIPGTFAVVATLLLPILGAACLVMPEPVAEHLPHLLGGVILFVGTADIVTDILERNSNPGKITVGTDVVMIVLGIVTLLNTHESLNVIAVMWGLRGLEDAAAEIDESRNSNPGKITVGTDVVMIVLGIVTLLNTHESLNVIAVMWGLRGLEDAAAEIDESLKAHAAGHKWIAPLASGIFELVLGTMLLLAPIANSTSP